MFNSFLTLLFPYQVKASLLTCRASQWTGFYVIGASVMKELNFMQRAGLLLSSYPISTIKLTAEQLALCIAYSL